MSMSTSKAVESHPGWSLPTLCKIGKFGGLTIHQIQKWTKNCSISFVTVEGDKKIDHFKK